MRDHLESICAIIWSLSARSFGIYLCDHLESICAIIWSLSVRSFGVYLRDHLESICAIIWSLYARSFGVYLRDHLESIYMVTYVHKPHSWKQFINDEGSMMETEARKEVPQTHRLVINLILWWLKYKKILSTRKWFLVLKNV